MKKIASGYTLIELMITVSIVAILVAVAVPNMQQFVKNERLTGQINTLISHLMLARSEAVKRNQSVVLCTSSNNTSCTANTPAQNGWIVYVDVDNSGGFTAGDELIKVQQALEGNVTLTNLQTVVYDNRGFAPSVTAQTYSLCDDRGNSFAKVLSISQTGRVRRSGVAAC